MRSYARGTERLDLEVVDAAITTRTFAAGELVENTVQPYGSIVQAKWELDRRCRDLEAAGFVRAGATDDGASLSHRDLASALAADPDELETYRVYADWLCEQGDPWGQLMAVQHAIAMLPPAEHGARRDELVRTETMLRFQHGARLWGTLGETIVDDRTQTYACDLIDASWHCGFIRDATIRESSPQVFPMLIRALAELEPASLLRSLTLISHEWPDDTLEQVSRHRWPSLRTLDITVDRTVGSTPIDANRLVSLVAGDAVPALTRLIVFGTTATDELCRELAAGSLVTHLQELVLARSHFTQRGIRALAGAKFASLRELRLSGAGPRTARADLDRLADRVVIDLRDDAEPEPL